MDKQILVSDKLPETVNIKTKKIRSVDSVSSQSSISCSSSSSSNNSNKAQIKEIMCLPQRHKPVVMDNEDLQIRSSMITSISNTETLVEATNRVFKVDQVYKSHLHFKKHVTYFADCWGFTVARAGHEFRCSRGGCLQKRKLQPNLGVRKTIPNKIGCEWMIRLRPLTVKHKKALGYDLLTDLGEKAVFIKLVCAEHTNGCCHGRNQYIICKKKAGGYAKELNVILHQLVAHMTLKDNGFADASYIRALMKKALPNAKAISSQEVFNVRVQAKLLMRKLRSKGDYLKHMEFKPTDRNELFSSLDNVTNDIFDEAVECAKEVYLSYMNDDKNNFRLFQYLDELASIDLGFTYSMSTDTNRNMTGFCWMTSTMRSSFERFSGCIFLDAMHKKTNVHLWPYMSIVIVNDLGEAQPVIEGFLLPNLIRHISSL